MSLSLTIKTVSGGKFTVQAPSADMSAGELKSLLHSEHADTVPDASRQRLIFKGRVLKDGDTLASYSIQEGNSLILVITKDKSRPTSQPAPSQAASSSVPQTSASQPAPSVPQATPSQPQGGFGGLGGSIADMQRHMLENPEAMQQMLNSPIMQSLLDNPELMQSMIMQNPQMRQLMEQNPEMAHVLNDPATLRQSMEMARNPELMREMTRNTDRAMSNIEAHPEGFNALRRMYETIQEPMYNAMSSQSGSTSTQVSQDAQVDSSARPDSAPMPNPWAPQQSSAAPQQSGPASQQGSSQAPPSGAAMPNFGEMGMGQNPEQMLSMLENPAMQQMMQQMMQNPEMMEAMISANPMARQMMDANPQLREMLRSPMFASMASNPQFLRSMMQMQNAGTQGAQAPSSGEAQPNPLASMFGSGAAQGQQGAQPNPFASLFGGGAPQGQQGAQPNPFASMFGAPQQASDMRPEILYRDQLAQLNNMGFTDSQANIDALISTGGNVSAAIDRLLQGP